MKPNKASPRRFCLHAGIVAALCAAITGFSLPASGQAESGRPAKAKPDPIYTASRQADGAESGNQAELRSRILGIAEAYATHRWRATEENMFHGKDPDGVQVDTPDISFCKDGWSADGRENVGVPYSWGGFCTIEKFDEYVKKGAFAGHAHTSGEARASRYTVGVDCSGFVSRCLDLPQKQTSLSMANICYRLNSYDELLPGDLLNKLDGHVVLFKEFTDASRKEIRYFEAGNWRVKETVRKVETLKRQNFIPMRYKPLDPRWVYLDFTRATFTAENKAASGAWMPSGKGKERPQAVIPIPLKGARTGEWAVYDVKQTRFPQERTVTRAVSGTDSGQIRLQVISRALDKEMMTEKIYDSPVTALGMIIGFASYDQEFEKTAFTGWDIEEGTYETGGRTFDARKITAEVKGSFLLHGKRYPVEFTIDYYQSDEVPLEGMLAATYNLEVIWSDGRKMSAKRSFTLSRFHVEQGTPAAR